MIERQKNGVSVAPGGIPQGLAKLVAEAGKQARARPVERWNPPYCGEIDIRIARDGAWFYRGSAISRDALVRLFASILRREPDGRHVLVTPVEKVGIVVEDAPFMAVELLQEVKGEETRLTFRTNVGDIIAAGPKHPLRFAREQGTDGLKPYVDVRGGLEALATRAVAHELVAIAVERGGQLGVWSGGVFFGFSGSMHG
jgi:uncharacterized protein